jgi:hypothetical protein
MNDEKGIFFETKEDSNRRRMRESQMRSSHERFIFFLQLCSEMRLFDIKEVHPNRLKNNFIIE